MCSYALSVWGEEEVKSPFVKEIADRISEPSENMITHLFIYSIKLKLSTYYLQEP